MKKLFLTSAAIVAVAVTSCGGGSGSAEGTVDTLSVKGEVLIPYEQLKMPGSVYTLDDKLYILNQMQADSIVEIWTRDGRKLGSYLTKGQGPGEVPMIFFHTMDKLNKRLLLCTNSKDLQAVVGLPELNPGLETIFTTDAKLSGVTDSLFIPVAGDGKVVMSNGVVVSANMTDKGLLSQYAPDGRFIRYDVDLPPSSEFGDGLPSYAVYNFMQPIIAASPDGKHFASSFGSADMFSIGTVDGDTVSVKTNYVSAPKGVKIKLGDGFFSFEYGDSYMTTYKGYPRLSDNYIYSWYVNRPQKEELKELKMMMEGEQPVEAKLSVYDFEGNLRRVIILDSLPLAFDVTADDSTLYVITETDEDGRYLLRYTLK